MGPIFNNCRELAKGLEVVNNVFNCLGLEIHLDLGKKPPKWNASSDQPPPFLTTKCQNTMLICIR